MDDIEKRLDDLETSARRTQVSIVELKEHLHNYILRLEELEDAQDQLSL